VRNGKELSASEVAISYALLDIETNQIESTLRLANVSSHDHLSNFTCELAQAEQTAQASFTLRVSFKPEVTLGVVDRKGRVLSVSGNTLTLFNDTDLTFTRAFRASPADSVRTKWLLDGREETNDASGSIRWLARSNRNKEGSANMTLACQVSNSVGLTEHEIQITLACK